MDIDVELKNYRCFPDENRARFTIRPGFTAFVGANNSGKSSLLKFFFESRPLFQQLSTYDINLLMALRGVDRSVGFRGLYDPTEMFSNTNNQDIEMDLRFRDPEFQARQGSPP